MSWKVIEVSEQDFLLLKDHNKPIDNINDLTPNEGVVVQSVAGQQMNAIFDSEVGIRRINDFNPQFKSSRNRDLARLNDLLSNPKVNQIIIDGFFGTGKTSTVMSHLVEYLKNHKEPQVYISKPHVPVGKSYGHLPGELKDKIHFEFRSYYQYIDRFWEKGMADLLIEMSNVDTNKNSMAYKELGGIQLEALPFEYIRGLDIPKGWVILDECQNTDIQEMVSFVSRNGDDVKLILLGDSNSAQIDRKSVLDPKRNGFTFIKGAYEDKPYNAVVNLTTRNHIIRGDRVKHLFDAVSSQNS
jgi:predicted ribonuclease YlaK